MSHSRFNNVFQPLSCTITGKLTGKLTANQLVKPKMADMENLDVSPWWSIMNPECHTLKVDYSVMIFVLQLFLTCSKINSCFLVHGFQFSLYLYNTIKWYFYIKET